MSEIESQVAAHYDRGADVAQAILDAFDAAGIAADRLTLDHLAGVDEFHLGGRRATLELLGSVDLGPSSAVLDVGCGIGGPARTIAAEAGCRVIGVDVTASFVDAAGRLSELTGLGSSTSFAVGTATDLDLDDDSVDVVTLLHVGMNLPDKAAVMAEFARVVRPGGSVVVYDVMRVGPGDVGYPVPWAGDESSSFLATPEEYSDAMRAAGLEPGEPASRTELVMEVVAATMADPPPVDLAPLVGPEMPTMFANLFGAIQAGTLAPTQLVARA